MSFLLFIVMEKKKVMDGNKKAVRKEKGTLQYLFSAK